jgi:hypothetical protein
MKAEGYIADLHVGKQAADILRDAKKLQALEAIATSHVKSFVAACQYTGTTKQIQDLCGSASRFYWTCSRMCMAWITYRNWWMSSGPRARGGSCQARGSTSQTRICSTRCSGVGHTSSYSCTRALWADATMCGPALRVWRVLLTAHLRRLRWGAGTRARGEGARERPPRAARRGRRGLSRYSINAVLVNPYANAVIRVMQSSAHANLVSRVGEKIRG